jgi:hypothetical protein
MRKVFFWFVFSGIFALKALTSEMDRTKIRFIRKAFIKERGAEVFLEKSARPHPVRAL